MTDSAWQVIFSAHNNLTVLSAFQLIFISYAGFMVDEPPGSLVAGILATIAWHHKSDNADNIQLLSRQNSSLERPPITPYPPRVAPTDLYGEKNSFCVFGTCDDCWVPTYWSFTLSIYTFYLFRRACYTLQRAFVLDHM
ncbi:hypothetical protein IW262DRAFT_499662 [Armillaria fumosa]|nr:hypothetical protein IW262DRAFT_499662 [Armillaria fumosa]